MKTKYKYFIAHQFTADALSFGVGNAIVLLDYKITKFQQLKEIEKELIKDTNYKKTIIMNYKFIEKVNE